MRPAQLLCLALALSGLAGCRPHDSTEPHDHANQGYWHSHKHQRRSLYWYDDDWNRYTHKDRSNDGKEQDSAN